MKKEDPLKQLAEEPRQRLANVLRRQALFTVELLVEMADGDDDASFEARAALRRLRDLIK